MKTKLGEDDSICTGGRADGCLGIVRRCGVWGREGAGSWCVIRNDEGTWRTQLQGGPDLCGSEKFHELVLIVSLGAHPSLTPKLPLLVPPQLCSGCKHSFSNTSHRGSEISPSSQRFPHQFCALAPLGTSINSPSAQFDPFDLNLGHTPRLPHQSSPPPPISLTTSVPTPSQNPRQTKPQARQQTPGHSCSSRKTSPKLQIPDP